MPLGIECGCGDTQLPGNHIYLGALLVLFQGKDNLFFRKTVQSRCLLRLTELNALG